MPDKLANYKLILQNFCISDCIDSITYNLGYNILDSYDDCDNFS